MEISETYLLLLFLFFYLRNVYRELLEKRWCNTVVNMPLCQLFYNNLNQIQELLFKNDDRYLKFFAKHCIVFGTPPSHMTKLFSVGRLCFFLYWVLTFHTGFVLAWRFSPQCWREMCRHPCENDTTVWRPWIQVSCHRLRRKSSTRFNMRRERFRNI